MLVGPMKSPPQARVESARTAALSFFHTDDDAHDVVFAANATAALKLVGESFPWQQGSAQPGRIHNYIFFFHS